jgi:hypothetical protein
MGLFAANGAQRFVECCRGTDRPQAIRLGEPAGGGGYAQSVGVEVAEVRDVGDCLRMGSKRQDRGGERGPGASANEPDPTRAGR